MRDTPIRLWVEAPIITERVPKVGGQPQQCVCTPAPFCTGPSGPGWLDCSLACKGCNPPKRRRKGQPSDGEP